MIMRISGNPTMNYPRYGRSVGKVAFRRHFGKRSYCELPSLTITRRRLKLSRCWAGLVRLLICLQETSVQKMRGGLPNSRRGF